MSNLSKRQTYSSGLKGQQQGERTYQNVTESKQGNEVVQYFSSSVFEYASGGRLSSFSDDFILKQLDCILKQLKQNTSTWQESKSSMLVHELSQQIHGLMARELRLSGNHSDYYQLLNSREKEIIKLQLKYGRYESQANKYEQRIADLQREIDNLRGSIKIYQGAQEQNQMYKQFFKEIQSIMSSSNKKVDDLQKLLKNQITPKINQFEVDLANLSKSTSRDRNKVKGLISKYSIELQKLSKDANLTWEKMYESCVSLFTANEQLNTDGWVRNRIDLAHKYEELSARHTSVLSLLRKNIDELVQKDSNSKSFSQIRQFEEMLKKQRQQGFETVILNGWVGLGVVHCHHHGHTDSQFSRIKQMFISFQSQFRKMIEKFPQLESQMNQTILQLMKLNISSEDFAQNSLGWLKDIIVHKTDVISVDNVYNYYSKSDKKLIFHLRVLIKSLLEEFHRICQSGVQIQIDQAIIAMLRQHVLEGVDVEDILAIFRPSARVCEVPVVIDRPHFLNGTKTVGIPLKQQQAIALHNLKHVPVSLSMPTVLYGQRPVELRQEVFTKEKERKQIPYRQLVTTDKIVQRVVQNETITQVPTQVEVAIQESNERLIEITKEVLRNQQVQVKNTEYVPQVRNEIVEVDKKIECSKYLTNQITKVIEIPTYIPVIQEKPTYEIIEKKVPHYIKQTEVRYLDKKQIVFEDREVPVEVEVIREKRVPQIDHCDCQKPETVQVKIEKEIVREIEKEIIVQKCHFIKGDEIEKIVDVQVVVQKPLIKQIIVDVERIVEKIVPLVYYEQKLVVFEKQIPIQVERYVPVPLTIEKPIILVNEEIKEVRVQVPVPVFIEKQVPKIVYLTKEKIVEKIVECPRVVEVEKIVQKIVVVPRIIEKIVIVPEIIQKIVEVECPVLELVTVQCEKVVPQKYQHAVNTECIKQVLKIEREIQLVEVIKPQEVIIKQEKLIEVERREEYIVERIIQIPRDIVREKLVEKVVHTRQAIPVQTIVQVPIIVNVPVPVEIQKPIFYRQPQIHIQDCRLEVEKPIYITNTKKQIHEVKCQVPIYNQKVVEIEVEKDPIEIPCLEIVEIEKNICLPPEVHERPVEKYFDMDRIIKVQDEQYIQGEKIVEYLARPTPIEVQKMIPGQHYKQVPVEMTRTQTIDTRAIDEVIKTEIVSEDRVVEVRTVLENAVNVQTTSEVAVFNKDNYKIVQLEKEILKIDTEEREVFITKQRIIDGLRDIIYKAECVPQYIERVVEKIILLPQIVEVEKKCYMIEEINGLIAKEVDLEVHTADYKAKIEELKASLDITIQQIAKSRAANTNELKSHLQSFRQILFSVDKMPKIVERIKEVIVEVEKDRPVLVPVFNSEQQCALELIIHDLISGISKLRREEREKIFDKQILDLFTFEFQSGDSGLGTKRKEHQEKSRDKKSWGNNYGNQMPETSPLVRLAEKFRSYYKTYSVRGNSFSDLVASFERHYIRENNTVIQDKETIREQKRLIEELENRIEDARRQCATLEEHKSKVYGEYSGIIRRLKDNLPSEQYKSVYEEYVSEEVVTEYAIDRRSIDKYASTMIGSQYQKGGSIAHTEAIAEKERKISEIYEQLSMYESQNFEQKRKVTQLERENELLKEDLKLLRSGMPQTESRDITERISRQWESRVKSVEESYISQINQLRQQYTTRREDTSNTTAELINENRKLEEQLRGLRREYDSIKSTHERSTINLENEKKKLIDEYERRLKGSTASSTIERDLRREVDTLKKNIETSEKKFESQKQKIIDDYERKINTTAGTQQRELRRQLETLKRSSQNSQQNWETQKQRINDDYERKITNLQKTHQNQLERVKSELERVRSELERVKMSTTRRETTSHTSPEQIDEIRKLRDTVNKLENELETSKKEIENYQKSKLGHTAYTSGYKRGGEDFQSPDVEYHSGRYGGRSYDFRSPQTESQVSKQEEQIQQSQISGRGEKESASSKRGYRSGVKVERKYEETEEIRSSSSRISGGSESSSIFKTSMNMKQFMDIKKIEDKDNIATLVMIKVIEKIQEEAEKGMLNSYSPSNIFLSNFNPNNIDSLIVRFGAPITNKKSKTDGLYLAPEIHRGEGTTLKSVVFTLAVIWDQLIHYEIYFKTNSEIENMAHEFKVRDVKLNPILKNTLFEMMSKEPSKRLQLAEAKRRLSLQRYILSEGKAVAASSRISAQSKKEQ